MFQLTLLMSRIQKFTILIKLRDSFFFWLNEETRFITRHFAHYQI